MRLSRCLVILILLFWQCSPGTAQTNRFAIWGANGYGEAWAPPNVSGIRAVGLGHGRMIAAMSDGRLIWWGNGNGNSWETNFPTRASNVMSIVAASSHIMSLSTNGILTTWSSPYAAALTNQLVTNGVVAIAGGYNYCVALKTNQQVAAWGYPVQIYGPPNTNLMNGQTGVKAIAAGDLIAVLLKTNGVVTTCSSLGWGFVTPPGVSNIVAVAAGYSHVLALRDDGTVAAWGYSPFGQTNVPVGLSNVIAIAAGGEHSLALCADGSVVGWGEHSFGQTDLPSGLTNIAAIGAAGSLSFVRADIEVPLIVKQPKGRTVVAGMTLNLGCSVVGKLQLGFQWKHFDVDIPGATNSTLVFTNISPADAGDYRVVVTNSLGSVTSLVATVTMGSITAWGYNGMEETEVPAGLTNVASIAAGANTSGVILTDGAITNWTYRWSYPPYAITDAKVMAMGANQNMLVRSNGTVVAWGQMTNTTDWLANVIFATSGGNNLEVLNCDGTVTEWGDNLFGQLNIPATLTNAIAIACGNVYSMATTDDGQIVIWGDDMEAKPANLTNVIAISVMQTHRMALKADGTVVTWGSGVDNVPADLTNAVAISCGISFNIALRNDGTVAAWSSYGSDVTNVPTWLHNVTSIAAGLSHVVVSIGDGSPHFPTGVLRRSLDVGGSLCLAALAVGNQPMTYRWQLDGVDIAGQTNALLSLDNLPVSMMGDYRVIASNRMGTTTGAVTTVSIRRQPMRFDDTTAGLSIANGTVRMRLKGLAGGGPIVVWASTNLTDWYPVYTNAPVIGNLDVLDAFGTNAERVFYRAVEGY